MITNRLVGDAFTLHSINNTASWFAGASTVISDGGPTELLPRINCRQIEIDGGVNNEIYLEPLPGDESLNNSAGVFTFAIKIPNGGTVDVSITDSSTLSIAATYSFIINASSPSINAEGVASPQWSIVRVITDVFDSPTPSVQISIGISKNQSETVYFSSPVFVPQMEFAIENTALGKVAALLPQFMLEDDFSITEPIDMPLMRFIDVCTVGLDSVINKTLDMSYLDAQDGKDEQFINTLSTLVNPRAAQIPDLIWLAKFVGTKPVTRFTSSLEEETEAFVLNSSELNGEDTLRLTSYSSLNPPVFDLEVQRDLLDWQVSTGSFGFNAGTTSAIEDSVKLMLIGNKTVNLDYDYSTSPFEIEIQTPWYETIGADETKIGESSILVLEAVQRAKPIGVLLTHVMTA